MEPLNEDQQMGMIVAKQQDAAADLQDLDIKFTELLGRFNALEKLITKKLTTVEAVFKTLRFLGYLAVAVATFHFGDVPKLWVSFFS